MSLATKCWLRPAKRRRLLSSSPKLWPASLSAISSSTAWNAVPLGASQHVIACAQLAATTAGARDRNSSQRRSSESLRRTVTLRSLSKLSARQAKVHISLPFGSRSLSSSRLAQTTAAPSEAFTPTNDPPPLNEAQVPLISSHLRAQLFPPHSSPFSPPPPSPDAVNVSLDHLRSSGLLASKPSEAKPSSSKPTPPAIDFELPQLQGPTLSHHFHALGHEVAEPYLSLARAFAEIELPKLPEKDRWVCMSGWTHYSLDGSWESVPYPSEESQAMVFDVETLPYQGSHFPIMAVAVGKDGWYSWCSPWLAGDDELPNHLIPFSPSSASTSNTSHDFLRGQSQLFERPGETPRVLVGHNVLFDRARVQSEYTLRRPSTRYVDTLSLHVAVSGLTNPQRPAYMAHRKTVEQAAVAAASKEVAEGDAKKTGRKAGAGPAAAKSWKDVGSLNSLAEVARLHCGIKIDKSLRNVLIDPSVTIADIRRDFDQMMTYCAIDVLTTFKVFKVLFPKFLATCPHPASFAGVLLMSQPVLPVDHHWPRYLERAESTYQERLEGVKAALKSLAEEARCKFEQVGDNGRFVWQDDLWLRQLDWSPKKARRLTGKTSSDPTKVPATTKVRKAINVKTNTLETAPKPTWYAAINSDERISMQSPLAALLFRATWRGFPVVSTHSHGWLFAVPSRRAAFKAGTGEVLVDKSELGPKDELVRQMKGVQLYSIPSANAGKRCLTLLGRANAKRIADGLIGSEYAEMAKGASIGKDGEAGTQYRAVADKLRELAEEALRAKPADIKKSVWLRQLDWSPKTTRAAEEMADVDNDQAEESFNEPASDKSDLLWPRWYWDLDVPGGGLDVSVRKRAVPLLLRLRWRGFPVVYSREHGWIYRVPASEVDTFTSSDASLKALKFIALEDHDLDDDTAEASFFKMPHPDGEGNRVGSPLSKAFQSAFEDGVLTSEYPAAKDALSLNASCSYWLSSRERIMDQMVVWNGDAKVAAPNAADSSSQGLILPQVIPMGTVTRRAVEKTWLTASNAKKNRVGSELKAMVRAPPGFAIVGADVDSEELWICSVMGDAQLGFHGATAIGWMTLEGTKSAGTDLHSKSASILGISRDDAKVFNYSRIYGAGVKHAVTLLLKSNPTLSTEQATTLAKELYAQTKGVVDRSDTFGRPFWHGGTESFVFNKLEQIARSERPRTPALGCGLTDALKKCFLPAEGKSRAGEGFMPSRINWVVQSSGVDYLHLLLVAMEYLTKRFEIDARYMISVHDEIRYLVKEQDKDRAAMALQVANLWTRSLFAYRLQMPDLPQSCAFFSAVDIDHCFRKEVFMGCVTPSNPDAIAPGVSVDIAGSLAATSHGSLFPDGAPMSNERHLPPLPPLARPLTDYEVRGEPHRVDRTRFLVAQTSTTSGKIRKLWKQELEDAEVSSTTMSASGASPPRRLARSPATAAQASTSDTRRGSSSPARRRRSSIALDEAQAASIADYIDSPPHGLSRGSAVVKQSGTRIEAAWELDDDVVPPEELEDEDYSPHKPLIKTTV